MFAASLNGVAGTGALFVGVVACTFAIVQSIIGIRQRDPKMISAGSRYAYVVFAAAVLAFAAMERALITRDFSLAYVQQVGSTKTPTLYNVTALWTALEGSILLWVLILAGYIAAVAYRFRSRRSDALVGWAMVVLFAIAAFFFGLSLLASNPFAPASVAATEGSGPNALLQNHVLVLFHPPALYLGYVGMSVPFAFAIAALVTGRVGEGWLLETRRWTLFAWGFLTLGIILGGWWSYEVLGWGGVWAWDPVENVSFLPWLTGTAYLHSVLVQERRGMLRVWNLSLLIATFSLTILGTFLTRSGVITSVHAFSESDIGPILLTFFGVIVAVSLGLIAWRGDRLRAPGVIDSPVSREGRVPGEQRHVRPVRLRRPARDGLPPVRRGVRESRHQVGAPFFDRLGIPIGITLLFLMAVAPVLPWRKASTEVLRDRLFWPAWCGAGAIAVAVAVGADGFAPLIAFGLAGFAAGAAGRQLVLATRRQGWRGLVGRANGGMIVHLGVILIAVGLTASNSYTRTQSFKISPGETVTFAGHDFTYERFEEFDTRATFGTKAIVAIDGGKAYAPARTTYKSQGVPVSTPSVSTGMTRDIYLTIEGNVPTEASPAATIKVSVKPLILWLWIGGALMGLGTLLSAFPGNRRRPTMPTSALPAADEPDAPGEPGDPAELVGSRG